jgi:iron complex transport system ATP-binding protein
MTSPDLLELRDLSAGYGKKAVLEGVNISIRTGELTVLAGPNGSGKTTLLKTSGGLVRPMAGHLFLDGRDGAALTQKEWAALRAYIFQTGLPSWPFTVYEMISQGRFSRTGLFGKDAADGAVRLAMERAGLAGFGDRRVTELSGGEYQRALLARAMVQEAKLFIMDEPCNNLDLKYQIMIMDLLKKICAAGPAVFISLHDLDLAGKYADRIILLSGGKVRADGAPKEILRDDLVREIFY